MKLDKSIKIAVCVFVIYLIVFMALSYVSISGHMAKGDFYGTPKESDDISF